MKQLTFTVLLFLTFLVGQTQTKNFLDQPYLEVIGTADTLVTPNEIFIKILITEKDTKDKIAVEELEVKMVNALKALGIDVEKNLTASDVSSNFKFYFLKNKGVLKSKQYMLKVRDAVTVSKVIIKLEELEISNTSIDHVDHSNLEDIKNGMRTKAVENARVRAIALTKPLNQNLGPAIHIADTEVYDVKQELEGKLAGVVVRGYSAVGKVGEEPPKIEFEKIKVTTNILVNFILK